MRLCRNGLGRPRGRWGRIDWTRGRQQNDKDRRRIVMGGVEVRERRREEGASAQRQLILAVRATALASWYRGCAWPGAGATRGLVDGAAPMLLDLLVQPCRAEEGSELAIWHPLEGR